MSFLLSGAKLILITYAVLYTLIHALIYLDKRTMNFIVFQNLVHWPYANFIDPTQSNLHNVHNFYLDVEPSVRIGVWHHIPKPHQYTFVHNEIRTNEQHFSKYIGDDNKNTVFIYVHGNDRDRASPFRVELCQNLVALGYHVFAIDYRGFGDSTGAPSEKGVVRDVIALYKLIMKYNKNAQIFLYGHSLGTGIVAHAARLLSESNSKLDGVVLEAPFLNIKQASRDYHISLLFLNNQWILKKVDESLDFLNLHFSTDKNIVKINTKILMMHGEDDWFIPQSHSIKLHEICSTQRPKTYPPVTFIGYEKEHGLGHFIHTHKPAYDEIKAFVDNKTK